MTQDMRVELEYLRRLNSEAKMGRITWLADFTDQLMKNLVAWCAQEKPLFRE